jgi:hypothetical protein
MLCGRPVGHHGLAQAVRASLLQSLGANLPMLASIARTNAV